MEHVTTGAADSQRQSLEAASEVLQICYSFSTTTECRVSTGKCGKTKKNFTINIDVGCLMLMASLKTAEEDVDVTDSTE